MIFLIRTHNEKISLSNLAFNIQMRFKSKYILSRRLIKFMKR